MNASYRNSVLVLIAGLAAVPFAFAGPGSQFWSKSAESKIEIPATVQTTTVACTGCAGMKAVALTTTRSEWANGRGPLQTFATGIQQVCHSCGAQTITMKPSWSNGRGPLQPVTLNTTHVCQTTLIAAK